MADNELLLNRADSAVLSRDYDLAARLYNTVLKENPNDKSLLLRLGNLYVKSGKDEKALQYFQSANSQDPTDGNILLSLGGIYRRLEKYDESINALNLALKAGADRVQVYYNQGFTYKFMGKYEEAIDCFETVITLNPSDVLAYNHLGTIYALLHDNDGAIQAFRMGLKIDSNHPILHLNLAKSLESAGSNEQAQREYETALRYKPGWPEASTNYTKFLIKEKKIKQAAELTRDAINLNERDPSLHCQLADILMEQYDYEEAAKEYKIALSLSPDNTVASCGLATAMEEMGNNSEAAELIEHAEPISADDTALLKKYAEINLSANRLGQASKKIKMLFDSDKDNPETLDIAGQYYICNNNDEKAENCFKRIEAIDSSYTDHLTNASKRYKQMGNLSQAEKYINNYISRVPNDSRAYSALASIDEALGKINEALTNYNKALKVDVNNIEAKKSVQRLMDSISAAEEAVEEPVIEEQIVQEEPVVEEQILENEPVVEEAVEESQETEQESEKEDLELTDEDFDFDSFGQAPLFEEESDEIDFDDINDTVEEENASLIEDENEPLEDFDFALDTDAADAEQNNAPSVPVEKNNEEPENIQKQKPVTEPVKAEENLEDEMPWDSFEPPKAEKTQEPLTPQEPFDIPPVTEKTPEPEMNSDLLKKMQEVTSNAERAINAADKAWYASQQAADIAQSVSGSEDEIAKKTKRIAEETAREAAESAVEEYAEKLHKLERIAKEAARKAEMIQDLPDPDEYVEKIEKRLENSAARVVKEAAEKVQAEIAATAVQETVKEVQKVEVPEVEIPEIEVPQKVEVPEIIVVKENDDVAPSNEKILRVESVPAENVFAKEEELITEVTFDDKDIQEAEKSVTEDDIYFADEIYNAHKNQEEEDDVSPVQPADAEEFISDAEPEEISTDFGEVSVPGEDAVIDTDSGFDESIFEEELASVLNDDEPEEEEPVNSYEEDRFVQIDAAEENMQESGTEEAAGVQSVYGELELSDDDVLIEDTEEKDSCSVDSVLNDAFDVEDITEKNEAVSEETEIPEIQFEAEEDTITESEPVEETVFEPEENNSNNEDEYSAQLALFKNLRGLSEFLPEKKKQQFMQSKVRVSLDYLISRLEGKKGLMEMIQSQTDDTVQKDDASSEKLSAVELTRKVLDDLKSMSKSLPDENLGSALTNYASEIESKL